MRMREIFAVLIVVSFMALSGCSNENSGGTGTSMMPNITGAAGEVLIIMPEKQYNSKPGLSLQNYLREEVPALPQSEPMFNVNRVNPGQFKRIMHTHRNIVRVTIGEEADTTAYSVKKDIWAHPQYVVDIKAPSEEDFLKLVKLNGDNLQRLFLKAEKMRTIRSYRKYEDPEIPKKLSANHKLYMTIPKGYHIAMNKKNFVWILKEKGQEDFYQSINIYYQDYLDTSDFKKSHLLKMREKFMKNIEGREPGSRMITEKQLPVSYERITLNNRFAVRMRGLWKKTGDILMGGPFISYSFVDEARNRMITVEGWVYAPDYDKRNFIWQLDAILRSTEVVPVEQKQPDKTS